MKTALAIMAFAISTLFTAGPAAAQWQTWTPETGWMTDTGISRKRLGVHITNMTEELRQFFGAPKSAGLLLSKVRKDSPAERAGLRVGDVVIDVDGQPISRFQDVLSALSGKDRCDEFTVTVIRKKRTIKIKATVGPDKSRLKSIPESSELSPPSWEPADEVAEDGIGQSSEESTMVDVRLINRSSDRPWDDGEIEPAEARGELGWTSSSRSTAAPMMDAIELIKTVRELREHVHKLEKRLEKLEKHP